MANWLNYLRAWYVASGASDESGFVGCAVGLIFLILAVGAVFLLSGAPDDLRGFINDVCTATNSGCPAR